MTAVELAPQPDRGVRAAHGRVPSTGGVDRPRAGLEQIPGLDVDAAPVREQGASLLVVDQPVLGVLVGDSFHTASELVEAPDRAQSREDPVVAVVDEVIGKVEVAGGVVPVVRGEHPQEQR